VCETGRIIDAQLNSKSSTRLQAYAYLDVHVLDLASGGNLQKTFQGCNRWSVGHVYVRHIMYASPLCMPSLCSACHASRVTFLCILSRSSARNASSVLLRSYSFHPKSRTSLFQPCCACVSTCRPMPSVFMPHSATVHDTAALLGPFSYCTISISISVC